MPAREIPSNEESSWAAVWTASVHGPYPVGNPTAQPEMSFAFPDPPRGAREQSFRLVIRPDAWGRHARIRLSNVFGDRPVTFTAVHVGLQSMSSAILRGTNRPVTFGGKPALTLAPGSDQLSDAIALDFIADPDDPMLAGRKLAVSFHVEGESGPMTWHAKSLQTCYVTPPGSRPAAAQEAEGDFLYPTASWYFLDALHMRMAQPTPVVCCFGDSISDGSGSTVNGDDRWPDVLSRRLHAVHGNRIAVINAGIGGNQILGPPVYSPAAPTVGGPSALSRIGRDVTSQPGVRTVIWLEGINDLGHGQATAEAVIAGIEAGVRTLRAAIPGVRIVMGTITSALNATTGAHGSPEVDARRRQINTFIRASKLHDGIVDFDAVTCDPSTGQLRPEMVPGSSIGGPGDRLHPNRIGYQRMATAFDIAKLLD